LLEVCFIKKTFWPVEDIALLGDFYGDKMGSSLFIWLDEIGRQSIQPARVYHQIAQYGRHCLKFLFSKRGNHINSSINRPKKLGSFKG